MLSFVPDSVRTARSTRSPPSGAAQLEHYGLVSFVRVVVVVDCDDVVCAPATPVIIPSATAAVMIYLAMQYLSCCDCRDRYPGHVHNLANMNVLLQVRLILIFVGLLDDARSALARSKVPIPALARYISSSDPWATTKNSSASSAVS